MDFAAIIREVGRGAQGAKPLDVVQAQSLFAALLDGTVPDLETGALLAALRMKGESDAELQGFFIAAQARVGRFLPWAGGIRPVVLPSYNGARRQANLTPLLAGVLATLGVPTVVHGQSGSFGRVTSSALFAAAGWRIAESGERVDLAAGGPVFVPIETLCPGLARLLALRARLGLRNAAHSVVKLVDPFGGDSVVVAAGTHPPYLASMRTIGESAALNLLLLRATEGEPYANPRRRPGMVLLRAGQPVLELAAEHESLTALPSLPASVQVADTLAWGAQVMDGKQPLPRPLADQVAVCLVASGMVGDLPAAHRRIADRFLVGAGCC